MDQRQWHLIVRPTHEPDARERKELALTPDEAVVRLRDPFSGQDRWFHLELALVWPLELD